MFNSAHDFYINNLFASDGNGGKDPVSMNLLKTLANAACLGAGHQSAERYDAPKCHPDTRVAVVNDVISWVNADVSKESIMWMSGPAGAGKSAIAQTVCEKCYTNRTLLAAFFFSRTASGAGRDDGNRLVPTIACQLAIAVPEAKSFIIDAFYKDPAVLSYSMKVQMEKLVLEPLSQVYAMIEQTESNRSIDTAADKQANEVDIPHLIVIDGLDECNDPKMQSNIIKMIANVLSKSAIRLRFLISSRPELEIRNTFQISSVSNICAQIVLNRDYDANDDIRVFLQSGFASLKREHTLASSLMDDSNWPSPDDIRKLVCKSSGQFVYASTIMKYLKDPRQDPRDVLKSILEFNVDSLYVKSPFAELDALYMQVLNTAVSNLQNGKDAFTIIFQVLLFQSSGGIVWLKSVSKIASFISMKKPTLKLLLSDLHSIIFVGDDDIHFYHASFQDFLRDPSRSRDFYIDGKEAHTLLAHLCFTHLYRSQPHDDIMLSDAELYSQYNYFLHVMESGYNHTVLKELRDINTSHLRTILSLTMKETFPAVEESPFKHFFIFNFHNVDFAIPKEGKLKVICDRMTEIIDENFLSSCPESVLAAIFYIVNARTNCIGQYINNLSSCWLAMLLEIPERGKHLYLDSKKYLSLYIMLCDASNIPNGLKAVILGGYDGHKFRRWHIHVMQYLLDRIEPSADIDTDDLQEMSTKIFKHYGGREEKNILKKNVRDKSDAEDDKERDTESYGNRHTEGSDSNNGDSANEDDYSRDMELDSFLQSVKAFLQKCVYLKNATLENAAPEHLANDVVEEHSDTLDHDAALKVHRSNHIFGSIRKLPRKIREMVRRH